MLGLWLLGCFAGVVGVASLARAAGPHRPRVHVVQSGQKLGSIAKRYGVSVEAVCEVNNIRPTDRLRVGERLIIPGSDDVRPSGAAERRAAPPPAEPPAAAREHRVYPGQTLAKIAKRYHVSVEALCAQNDLDCRRPLKPGTLLTIPGGPSSEPSHPTSEGGEGSRADTTWARYLNRPRKRGFVTLVGFEESWRGPVMGRGGQVLPHAREGISRVMGATGSRPRADGRLCQLIAKVSDAFGGRPLRVVSGFRLESYSASSHHRRSEALDFAIPGVPNHALRDYLLSLGNVGVGYYPNSSFVHLDVRARHTYWVDYSGPGEPPRYRRGQPPESDNPGEPAPEDE
jgi:LysM repeat protein